MSLRLSPESVLITNMEKRERYTLLDYPVDGQRMSWSLIRYCEFRGTHGLYRDGAWRGRSSRIRVSTHPRYFQVAVNVTIHLRRWLGAPELDSLWVPATFFSSGWWKSVPCVAHSISAPYTSCSFLSASWLPTIEHLRCPGSSAAYNPSSPSGSRSFFRKPWAYGWASEILIPDPTYLLSFVIAISTISFAGDFQSQWSIDPEVLHLILLYRSYYLTWYL